MRAYTLLRTSRQNPNWHLVLSPLLPCPLYFQDYFKGGLQYRFTNLNKS